VDHSIGDAGRYSARGVPAAEAAPRAALLGDGYGPSLVDTTATAPILHTAQTCFTMELAPCVVGRIMGPKGQRVRSLERASGCMINTEFNRAVEKMIFRGTQAQIDLAVAMVQVLLEGGSLDTHAYAAQHAAQMRERRSCGSPPSVKGRKLIVGRFAELEARLPCRSAAAEDALVPSAPSSSVASATPSSLGQAHASGSASSDASADTPLSDVSTVAMSACEEEQSAGHPSRQSSKRSAPLTPGPATLAGDGRGKRARLGHGDELCLSRGAAFLAPPPVLVELMPMRGRPSASAPVIHGWKG
jgi:hypothetical protein